jgi:hypothetical protein
MITTQNKTLLIELQHPVPKEYAADLQQALCCALRVLHTDAARDVPALDGQELCNAANPITFLLQNIIFTDTTGGD